MDSHLYKLLPAKWNSFCSHVPSFYKNYAILLTCYACWHKHMVTTNVNFLNSSGHSHFDTYPCCIFTCVLWHVISENIPTRNVFHVEVFNYSRRNGPFPGCRSTNYYRPKCLYHFKTTLLSTINENYTITSIPFMFQCNARLSPRTIDLTAASNLTNSDPLTPLSKHFVLI